MLVCAWHWLALTVDVLPQFAPFFTVSVPGHAHEPLDVHEHEQPDATLGFVTHALPV